MRTTDESQSSNTLTDADRDAVRVFGVFISGAIIGLATRPGITQQDVVDYGVELSGAMADAIERRLQGEPLRFRV